MSSTIAKVGSTALIELKNDLTQLSKTLLVIYDLMNADMRQIGEAWQDRQYQQFVQGYQPQIQKCEEIANRYAEWCAKVLEPAIQNVVAVEMTDVSNGAVDGSVGGMVIGGAVVAGTVVGGAGIAKGFNMEANNVSRPSTKAVPISNGCGSESSGLSSDLASAAKPFDAFITGTSLEEQTASCDQHDKDYYFGVPKEQADGEFEQRSPIMGAAVKGDVGTAYERFANTVNPGTIHEHKLGGTIMGGLFDEYAKETANESYANAQRDRVISQSLQSTWEEEHQQSLDANNYRVDVEEGGFSKI